MDNLYKNFDIPEGLTASVSSFLDVFNKAFLQANGLHIRHIKFEAQMPILRDNYAQYSIDTSAGEVIISNNSMITYLGNGKWDIPEKVSDKDEKENKKEKYKEAD